MTKDDTIQIQVMAELHRDPRLYNVAAEIGVVVSNGVVTLFGTVNSYAQRISAEKAALRVRGVNSVYLDIKILDKDKPSLVKDAEIRDTIHKIFINFGQVDFESISINIENGWVYLEGIVEWASDKLALKRLIEKAPGVKKVINKIKVKHRFSNPLEIKNVVLAELERYPFIDADDIGVEVEEQTVTLFGEVQSTQETEDAELIVASIPEVKQVINSLTVDFEIYAN